MQSPSLVTVTPKWTAGSEGGYHNRLSPVGFRSWLVVDWSSAVGREITASIILVDFYIRDMLGHNLVRPELLYINKKCDHP